MQLNFAWPKYSAYIMYFILYIRVYTLIVHRVSTDMLYSLCLMSYVLCLMSYVLCLMSYIRPAIITIALTAYHKIVSLSRYIFVDDV